MAYSEIDSFILKLKNLMLAGIDANLNIKTEDGKATITLTAEVKVSNNVQPHPYHRHVGAARVRRRERRAAERAAADLATAGAGDVAAEEEASTEEVEVLDKEIVAEESTPKVRNKFIEKVTNPSEDVSEEDKSYTESSDEEIEHACDRCDFVGKTAAGLKTHKSKKHLFSSVKTRT